MVEKRKRADALNASNKTPEEIAAAVLNRPPPPEREEKKAAHKAQRHQDEQLDEG